MVFARSWPMIKLLWNRTRNILRERDTKNRRAKSAAYKSIANCTKIKPESKSTRYINSLYASIYLMCLFAASGRYLLPELSKGAKSRTFVKSQNTRKPFKLCSGMNLFQAWHFSSSLLQSPVRDLTCKLGVFTMGAKRGSLNVQWIMHKYKISFA